MSSNKPMHLPFSPFSRLIAEHEQDWLAKVYVPPSDFDAMLTQRSILVYGRRGEGKTALRLMLAHEVQLRAQKANKAPPLIVDWRPNIFSESATGSTATRLLLKESSRVTAKALLSYFVQQVNRLPEASTWFAKLITAFVHHHLGARLDIEIGRLEDRFSAEQVAQVSQFLKQHVDLNIIDSDAIDAGITDALSHFGIEGVWLMIDGLEAWADTDPKQLGQAIKDLFSTLGLYEVMDVTIKLMAPDEIKGSILNSGALTRRRIDPFELRWNKDTLKEIVRKRLAFVADNPNLQLADVYSLQTVETTLSHLDGPNASLPRIWLDTFNALSESNLPTQDAAPTPKVYNSTTVLNVLPLRIDRRSGEIFVGQINKTTLLSEMERRILLYLFDQYPRLCSREEIYYRVYVGLDYVPRDQGDDHWLSSKYWHGKIDTIVYRIRQSIEADPYNPCYLVTVPRRGLRLENTM